MPESNRSYKIILIFLSIVLLMFSQCKKGNMPPTAKFEYSPYKGNPTTLFVFDATQSKDDNDSVGVLQARWDWDNDGIWDTDFSTELICEHKFYTSGIIQVRLELMDSEGLSSILSREIIIEDVGPLFSPEIDFPAHGSKNIRNVVMLSWSCYQVNNEDISYSIYFGDNLSPPLIASDYNSTSISPGRLKSGTNYFWRVVAKDSTGNESTSPLSVFYTYLFDERDRREYNLIKTDELFWMAENLNFETDSGWWCHSEDPENCDKYGKLYNWETAMIACPPGWHLPSDTEWMSYEISLFMYDATSWGARGTNQADKLRLGGSSGFNAILSGTRNLEGEYSMMGTDAGFWTSTGNNHFAYYRYIFFEQSVIFRTMLPANHGLSVRCVKEKN